MTIIILAFVTANLGIFFLRETKSVKSLVNLSSELYEEKTGDIKYKA